MSGDLTAFTIRNCHNVFKSLLARPLLKNIIFMFLGVPWCTYAASPLCSQSSLAFSIVCSSMHGHSNMHFLIVLSCVMSRLFGSKSLAISLAVSSCISFSLWLSLFLTLYSHLVRPRFPFSYYTFVCAERRRIPGDGTCGAEVVSQRQGGYCPCGGGW